MSSQRVTKATATKVLRLVEARFVDEHTTSRPTLIKDWDWIGAPGWTIVWEEGPYDWAIGTGLRNDTYWTEPYAGWALCVWPRD